MKRRSMQKLLPKSFTAKQAGYSLAIVMILGAVTSLWVEALMATMIPTYERMTLVQGRNMARSAAEAGLDYVVSQLNAAAAPGTALAPWSAYDTKVYGQTQYTSIPSAIIGSSSMKIIPKVVVGVTNYAPSTNSALYDSTVAANLPPNTTLNPWRIVDAYASVGPFSKHIRLILEPTVTSGLVTTQNALPSLPFAVFGNIQVDSIGMVSVLSYNNPSNKQYWNGDVGSNGTVNELGTGNMARPVLEGGNHIELPDPAIIQMPGQQVTFNNGMGGTVVASAPWLQIGNNVYSNNNTDGYNPGAGTFPSNYPASPPTVPASPSSYNVLGLNNGVQSNGTPVGGTVTEYQTNPLANIPPAPSAPSGSYGAGSSMPAYQASGGLQAPGSINLGNIALSNGSQLVISDSATSIPSSLNISDGSTVTIPPGNYIVNSVSVADTSGIVVNSSNPTGIYIQGNTPGTAAMAISNSAAINVTANGSLSSPAANGAGVASNLQIYYNGSSDVGIDGQMSAVVYAPNVTNVYVGQGLSNATRFYGAVVGGNVYLNGGLGDPGGQHGGVYFNYDYQLKPVNNGETSGGAVFGYGTTLTNTYKVTGFHGVSWLEVHDNPNSFLGLWPSWPAQVTTLLGL